MTASNVKESNLCLQQNLTVRSITAIQQTMLEYIDNNHSITIELPEDCQADISFIQLIEAARIYTGTAGKTIALEAAASGSTLDVLKRSGFLERMSAEDEKFWLHQGGIQ